MTLLKKHQTPKLTIGMPALSTRDWQIIANQVKTQIKRLSNPNDVEFLVELDNGKATSGSKRNLIMAKASGQYIAFIDDDDQLSDNYLSEIMKAIQDGPDVVTFNLKLTKLQKPKHQHNRIEIWKFGNNEQQRTRGIMTMNHLCAWRFDLARLVAWSDELGNYDDHLWFEPLFRAGVVETTKHVNQVLYNYFYHSEITANQVSEKIQYRKEYIKDGLRCWKTDGRFGLPEIYIEVSELVRPKIINSNLETHVWVRDKENRISSIQIDILGEPFHIIRNN